MLKIFEKIRTMIFGERSVTEKGKQIVKSKNLTPNQKLEMLFQNYSKYLNQKFYSDVAMETYELYYECFMNGKIKNEFVYEKYRQGVEKDMSYLIATQIAEQVYSLTMLNKEEITEKQQQVLQVISYLKENYFRKGFNFGLFYFNKQVREELCKIDDKLLKILREYNKTEEKTQTTIDDIFEL